MNTTTLKEDIEITPLVNIKIIQESLERIGIANKLKKELYPSCYLIEKNGNYYIYHFKQMFKMFKKTAYNNITEEDLIRRNAIIFCLKNWELIKCNDDDITPHNLFTFVLPHKDKMEWQIKHKFNRNLIRTISKGEQNENI